MFNFINPEMVIMLVPLAGVWAFILIRWYDSYKAKNASENIGDLL